MDGNKELYILTGMETFAKRSLNFKKVLRELKSTLVQKSTGFCHMSVTTSLLCLRALLRDD